METGNDAKGRMREENYYIDRDKIKVGIGMDGEVKLMKKKG